MKVKVLFPVLLLPLLTFYYLAAKYDYSTGNLNSGGVNRMQNLLETQKHKCDYHKSGRDYSVNPIVLYKNASLWNSHTPRNYYYWVDGLPTVECDIPCIFTWDDFYAKRYADVYFWDGKPGSGCDSHSLNFYSTMESPARYKYETVENLRKAGYDILATVDQDSDIPLTYVNKNIFSALKKSAPSPKRNDIMVSAFISNCDSEERLEYLKELMRHNITVHSFGKCLHNADERNVTGLNHNDKGAVMKHYKFHFCFENSVYKDYVSEKVYNALSAGTVPIYYGAPNFADYVPKNSVIDVRLFASPKKLAEYLIMLNNNEAEYNKYMVWRKDFRKSIPETMMEAVSHDPRKMLCRLCIKAADTNRLRYGLERIPEDKRWEGTNSSFDGIVFLVREYGKYWMKPVRPNGLTINSLKRAIIKELRPDCKHCHISSISKKYHRDVKIQTNNDLKTLENYSELEATIIDF